MKKVVSLKHRKDNRVPILIIENDADQWLIIRSALAQCFPEVKPIWINNPAQAFTYLEDCSASRSALPGLILSELYLPRRDDGLALLASIKTHLIYQRLPVIILSSSEEYSDIVETYRYSIASYIIKPNTYHQWLVSFYTFRRYWWDWVASSFRSPHTGDTSFS